MRAVIQNEINHCVTLKYNKSKKKTKTNNEQDKYDDNRVAWNILFNLFFLLSLLHVIVKPQKMRFRKTDPQLGKLLQFDLSIRVNLIEHLL